MLASHSAPVLLHLTIAKIPQTYSSYVCTNSTSAIAKKSLQKTIMTLRRGEHPPLRRKCGIGRR